MDRRYDLAVAVAIFALGVFVVVITGRIPLGVYRDAVGPRAFFFGIGFFFMAGSGLIAVNLLRSWKSQKGHLLPPEGETDEEGYPASPRMAAGVVGISVLYALLLNSLGYLISTPLYLIGVLTILKERGWKWIVLFAVAFTVICYVAFAQVLNMPIPVGPFTDWFRERGWIIL